MLRALTEGSSDSRLVREGPRAPVRKLLTGPPVMAEETRTLAPGLVLMSLFFHSRKS